MQTPSELMPGLAPNMALAVNSAANQIIASRERLWRQGTTMSGDIKRSHAWCEYGFPESISNTDLYNMYSRNGLAFAGVDKTVKRCWLTNPWFESASNAAWAERANAVLNAKFWSEFSEADRRRLAGRFSALVLRYKAAKGYAYRDPVKTKYVSMDAPMAVWGTAIKPTAWGTEPELQGVPSMWQYTPDAYGDQKGEAIDVHNDRVFILGDYSNNAMGFLIPAYNDLINIEKITGGTGESFLKNAARQIVLEYDKEIDFKRIAEANNVNVAELRQMTDEYMRRLNRGIDSALSIQGGTAKTLTSTIADPEPSHTVSCINVAAAFNMPMKIMTGSQTGERASTEDNREWNATCQSRRVNDLSPAIMSLVTDRLVPHGILEAPPADAVVKWDDLTASTLDQRLASAKLMAEINKITFETGGQVPFTATQILDTAGFDDAEGRLYD